MRHPSCRLRVPPVVSFESSWRSEGPMKPAPAEQLDIFASRAKYRPLVDSRLEFPRLSTMDHGADYDAGIDRDRLGVQLRAIRTLMLDGKWRTVQEVAEATGAPENSA